MRDSWKLAIAALCLVAVFWTPGTDPTPDVVPDPPVPVVVEPLIPGDGPRLLIVTESDDWRGMPASQVSIKTSVLVREWIKANNGDARFFDDDTDLQFVDASWRKGMTACDGTLPRIVVSNGKNGGFCGPLPETVEGVIRLLEEHGK